MAYVHSRYEVMMTRVLPTAFGLPSLGIACTAGLTGIVQAIWHPGSVPHLVRGVAFSLSNLAGVSGGTALFEHAKPAWTASNSATQIALLTFTSTILGAGDISLVRKYISVLVKPGESVNFKCETAEPNCRGWPILYVEPVWEHPTLVTSMKAST